jgi:exodeoxyribonuclease VII large subunit
MDLLDFLPQSNRLAARLGHPSRDRVDWLKAMLPPERTYGPNERAWLFGTEHAEWAVAYLLPAGFEATEAFRRRFPELHDAPTLGGPHGEAPVRAPEAAPQPGALSVNDLLGGLARVVRTAYPDRIHVAACLGGLRHQAARGYLTGDLVDLDEDGRPGAKIGFYIAREALGRIEGRLAAVGHALVELLPVLVRGQVTVKYGRLQVEVEDVDPAYTLGRTRITLEQSLQTLRREGLADRQAGLRWPELPLRVGLIAAADADGTRDFCRTLEDAGLPFAVRLAAVRMQGDGLAAGISEALERLSALDLDVIAVVRGGGAGADMQGFNALELARAVCRCPVPVLIGIGHDHDQTLLDLVARSQRTPTAAGKFLVETVEAAVRVRELRLRDVLGRLGNRLTSTRARLDTAARAVEAVPASLDRRAEALTLARERLAHRWHTVVAAAARRTDLAESRIKALPERLRREVLRLESLGPRLAQAPGARVSRERLALANSHQALGRLATRRLEATRMTLTRQPLLLEARATRLAERAGQGLALRAERLMARDPARLLAQGYALVMRPGGRLVRGAGELSPGETVRLRLADGTVTARVEEAQEAFGGG